MNRKRVYFSVIVLIVFVPLISVYLINGIIGGFFWTVVKLIYPIVGVIILLGNLILLIAFKKKVLKDCGFILIISITLISPILLTVGIIPHKFPSRVRGSDILAINSLFKEEVVIGQGGYSFKDNGIHVAWPSERWAYDIVKEPYDTGNSSLDSYGIWGLEVYSPANGKVISICNDEIDIKPNSEEFLSLNGNYVFLEVFEDRSYLILSHFMKGSIPVKEGDRIKVGDYLGKVGNSGTTSEPHLHIHHQMQNPLKRIHPIIATGLPLFFKQNNRKGKLFTKGEYLEPTNN